MKRLMCALLAVFVIGACSDEPAPVDPGAVGRADAGDGPSNPSKNKPDRPGRKGDGGRGDAGSEGDGKGGSKPGASGDEEDNVFNDGGEEDDASSAVYPSAGRYIYRQSGFERFCQAARCEDYDLPPSQPVDISLQEPSPDRAVVISEIRASDNRLVRTTATYTRADALITQVYARFSYEGFTFEETYRPEPPVESLRFPLQEGSSWSGRWKARTSGDYEVDVIGTEQISVGGSTVRAFKLSSVTNFEGEFDGTAKALIWVDPATKAMVKTTGKLDLQSAFGRYITEFTNVLRSGPGY